jgi:cell division septum initiation protein DivIVA
VALDRHNIEKKDLPLGERGYDPDAVDAHLAAIADEVTAFKEEARRRSDTVASSASDRVRTIVEAAEQSAAEINRAAEQDAREIRDDANNEAQATREHVHREAREYLDKVAASSNAMLERLNGMEQEIDAMVESVRTGAGRLNADLEQLQNGFDDVTGAIAPRPAFVPDEPAAPGPPASEAYEPAAPAWEPVTASDLYAVSEAYQSQADELEEPQFAERFPPAAEPEPVVEAAPTPEAVAVHSVAGDSGHSNGFGRPQSAPQGADAEGARLIALNMALNGTPREETARYLSENFHLSDAGGLLDEVYASVES